jgi:glycosyltransferase involved in cell wall biosynthesis
VKVVVDAIGVRPGSAAIVIGNLISGWTVAAPQDDIVVLADGPPEFPVPAGVEVDQIGSGTGSRLGRLRMQSLGVRQASRRHGADIALSAVTASAFLGTPCPHGAIVYDLRHELRPQQFSRARRISRRLLYGWTLRRADALVCISERTRSDLVARRPQLRAKSRAALLGADHARDWRPGAEAGFYVLAFGHFANKNVGLVLAAWRIYAATHPELTLRICGLGEEARAGARRAVVELGIADRVELLPWLTDDEFQSVFAGARCVLFPSDFEGFGLPAVEAMLLGVPVVISTDPALLEVTAGHAVVAADGSAQALATAVEEALALDETRLGAAAEHARTFTWERTARVVRETLTSTRATELSATSRNPRRRAGEIAP